MHYLALKKESKLPSNFKAFSGKGGMIGFDIRPGEDRDKGIWEFVQGWIEQAAKRHDVSK